MFSIVIHKYDDIEIEYVLQEEDFIILWYNFNKGDSRINVLMSVFKCFMILFPFYS
jgi:hypothetical protein